MSAASVVERATSLEKFLNRSVLFIQGIERTVPRQEVLQLLSQVCRQPQQGRIDILTGPEGNRGTAFLNFHNPDDASNALEKWRFGLELRGRALRVQFSSDREFKDIIQGPLVSKFKILVRNVPEELGAEDLFATFSEYGEILQLYVSSDSHGQCFAIIQFIELSSVQTAIRNANRSKLLSNVILVEAYRPNASYAPLPRNFAQPVGAPPQPRPAPPQPGVTFAALQQQEEYRMAQEASRPQHAAAGTSSGSGGGAHGGGADADALAPPSGAATLTVPAFYASALTAPPPGASVAGSLHSLLETALQHVKALDELIMCPITQEVLVDPVLAADGHTYERAAIEAWLLQNDTSPYTNEPLPTKALTPNILVRKFVEAITAGAPPASAEPPPASGAGEEEHAGAGGSDAGAAAAAGGGGSDGGVAAVAAGIAELEPPPAAELPTYRYTAPVQQAAVPAVSHAHAQAAMYASGMAQAYSLQQQQQQQQQRQLQAAAAAQAQLLQQHQAARTHPAAAMYYLYNPTGM